MNEEKIMDLLDNHEKRIKALEDLIKDVDDVKRIISIELNYEKMKKEMNLDENAINSIFDYNNQLLTLLQTLGKNDKEKTQNITLLIILGYDYLLGINQIKTKEIRRNVSEHGISLNNFATHLKEIMPLYISRIGKTTSPKSKYRLTTPGYKQAKKILLLISEEHS